MRSPGCAMRSPSCAMSLPSCDARSSAISMRSIAGWRDPSKGTRITQALRRIEAGLADEHRRREIVERDLVERDLAELKRHVAALQAQIEDIEQRLGE